MSLLHDALKKAEKTSTDPLGGRNVLVDADIPGGLSSTLRILVLTAVVSVLVLVIVYQKFIRKPSSPVAQSQSAPAVQTTRDGGQLMRDAEKLIQQGNLDEARTNLEKAVFTELPNDQAAEAYNNLGFVLKQLGKNEEAFQRYQKALSLNPKCAECENNLGVLYLTNRDFPESEKHFREALKSRADYAEPHLHLALLQESRGDYAGAKSQYTEYMKLARGVSADFLVKIQERMASLEGL